MKEFWKDPNSVYHTEEYWKKYKEGCNVKGPNKPETIILNLLNKLFPNEWEYTGDYRFWVKGKNPDFINHSKKKIIEHFGTWWHGKELTGKDEKLNETERIKHFEHHGYETLIIWENELKDISILTKKLQEFITNNKILLSSKTMITK